MVGVLYSIQVGWVYGVYALYSAVSMTAGLAMNNESNIQNIPAWPYRRLASIHIDEVNYEVL